MRRGENSTKIGKHNRNRVLIELMKSPKHFSALKRELKMSNATLTGHIKSLLDEGYLKREIQGRKIVYVALKERQTVLEMRKECWNELALLMFDYGICLTKKTKGKLKEALDVLKESIDKREQDVDVAGRMLGIPESPLDKTYVGKLKTKTARRSEDNGQG